MSVDVSPNSYIPWPRVLLAGLPTDLLGSVGALEIIGRYASGEVGAQLAVVSANLDHVHHFRGDDSWRTRTPATKISTGVHVGASFIPRLHWLTLLDGAPLVHKAERMTGCSWPKLSGSDLIHPLLATAADRGWRVGFLGGTTEAHEALRATLAIQMPGLTVTNCWAPERSLLSDPDASSRLAREIADSRTEILVVGLGKPRQENWIEAHGTDTGANVLLAFGAVVDFLAGRFHRAPQWVTGLGAEWIWRLSLEPRRLARRYLLYGPPAYLHLQRESTPIGNQQRPNRGTPMNRASLSDTVGTLFAQKGDRAEVAVIIVTHNSAKYVPELVRSLRIQAQDQSLRVVICDNASTDGTGEQIAQETDIELVRAGGNLGYAGGINLAYDRVGQTDAILVLNPDMVLRPRAISTMLSRVRVPGVGVVVPTILSTDMATYPSLRREPTLLRALGDALVGRRFAGRPGWLAETDHRPDSYTVAHQVDWATGAALLIRREAADAVGAWNENFFLYSEETDFCRRIRDCGYQIWFEPDSVVSHRGAGSGTSPALDTLMAVNRVRYAEIHKNPCAAILFRGAVALAELMRSYDENHRRTLGVVLNRGRWAALPHAPSTDGP